MEAAPEDFRTILQTFLLPFYTAFVSCTQYSVLSGIQRVLVTLPFLSSLPLSISLPTCLPAFLPLPCLPACLSLIAQIVLASLKKPMYSISLEEDFLIVFRKVCTCFKTLLY